MVNHTIEQIIRRSLDDGVRLVADVGHDYVCCVFAAVDVDFQGIWASFAGSYVRLIYVANEGSAIGAPGKSSARQVGTSDEVHFPHHTIQWHGLVGGCDRFFVKHDRCWGRNYGAIGAQKHITTGVGIASHRRNIVGRAIIHGRLVETKRGLVAAGDLIDNLVAIAFVQDKLQSIIRVEKLPDVAVIGGDTACSTKRQTSIAHGTNRGGTTYQPNVEVTVGRTTIGVCDIHDKAALCQVV